MRKTETGIAKMLRYSMASTGPVASAGAQFVLSLVLLRVLAPQDFGSFSFLLVACQFSWGVWAALFCAPLPILLNDGKSDRAGLLQCMFSTNLLGAALAFLIFWGLGLELGLSMTAALLSAAYAAIALLRWFARAYAYAIGEPLRTMFSDLVYSAVLIIGVGVAVFQHSHSANIAYADLLVAAALGLLPFGARYLMGQFARFKPAAIGRYQAVWRRHSGWSLLGVLTTEATANAHVYIVTLIYGSKAFAPIAASALLIRPVGVAMNALTEYERAQMARQVRERNIEGAMGAVRYFRLVLMAAWTITAIATVCLLAYAPRLVFPKEYSMPILITGAALWMVVAAIRTLRTAESALLQAAGAFRPLAFASVVSSGISILAVGGLLMTAGTLWSILGIFIGETVYAIWIWRQVRRWRVDELARPLPSEADVATAEAAVVPA